MAARAAADHLAAVAAFMVLLPNRRRGTGPPDGGGRHRAGIRPVSRRAAPVVLYLRRNVAPNVARASMCDLS